MEFLFSRINYEKSIPDDAEAFRFHTIEALLSELGRPHVAYPTIHVAGTKGKGSVTLITASILRAAGLNVGSYTSPHLQGLEERIQLNGQHVAITELEAKLKAMRPFIERIDQLSLHDARYHPPTFFEITTCLAFALFADFGVDCAVIEVGLGGRLDSTNVVESCVSVINTIGLDHTQILGATVELIAAEKAGIIKPGIPTVCGSLPPPAQHVVDSICRKQHCDIYRLGQEIQLSLDQRQQRGIEPESRPGLPTDLYPSFSTSLRSPDRANLNYTYEHLQVPLAGTHQCDNAAVAIAAANLFAMKQSQETPSLSQQIIGRGLQQVLIPGRFQVFENVCISPSITKQDCSLQADTRSAGSVKNQPAFPLPLPARLDIVLDIAHNRDSCKALSDTYHQFVSKCHECWRVLVFAASRDKDFRDMLLQLAPEFDEIILTRYLNNPRSLDPQRILESVGEAVGAQVVIAPLDRVLPRLAERVQNPPGLFSRKTAIHERALDGKALDGKTLDSTAFHGPASRVVACVTGSAFIVGEFGELLRSHTSIRNG